MTTTTPTIEYENEPMPLAAKLHTHLKLAGDRFLHWCDVAGYKPPERLYIAIDSHSCYQLQEKSGEHGRVMKLSEARSGPHVIVFCDPRLLLMLLQNRASWQQARLDELVCFELHPTVLDAALLYRLNDLHI